METETQSDGPAARQTTAFPRPKTNLFVADAEANKVRLLLPRVELDPPNPISQAITTYRAKFPKDVNHYAILASFGSNVVVSEGEEWKKYRKLVAPAFSEVRPELRSSPNPEYNCQRNNKLVWNETIRIMTDLFDNVWGDKSEVVVDHCVNITLPVRFLWLILCTWPNILTRLRSLSSAPQVVYSLCQPWWSYDSPY
jgi:hypothetical protein